jgi:hypothetical protein
VVTADELTDAFDAVVLAVKADVLDAAMADIAAAALAGLTLARNA